MAARRSNANGMPVRPDKPWTPWALICTGGRATRRWRTGRGGRRGEFSFSPFVSTRGSGVVKHLDVTHWLSTANVGNVVEVTACLDAVDAVDATDNHHAGGFRSVIGTPSAGSVELLRRGVPVKTDSEPGTPR